MSQTAKHGPVPATAVVGLGQMGRGIARNLDAAGLLVAAHDLCQDAFAAAEFSARVCDGGAADLTTRADVVLFAVPSTVQIAELLEHVALRPGQIIVDLTTSDPNQSRDLSGRLAASAVGYLDSAMTGGAAGADAGTLTLMTGGSADDVARCRPVFDVIASRVFHMGGVGTGHAMKLVHNMILHSSFLATCEGLRLAEQAGLDPASAVEVLNAGNARSFVTEVRFPRDILSGTMNARSRIANLEKDLGLAVGFAARQDSSTPYGSLTHTLLAAALDAGHGDADFSWLFPLFGELSDKLEETQ